MHLDLRMRPDIFFDHRRAVGVEPVPDDEEGARNMALKVTEGDHHVVSADGTLEMSLVNAARQGQPDDRGQCPALADASQDRGLPPRSPRGPRLGPERKAGLIYEHDLACRRRAFF